MITDHRFVGKREWGLHATPNAICQAEGCGKRYYEHWQCPSPDSSFWTESVHDSEDYDSPRTAILNILQRNANVPSDNSFDECDLAEMIADHIYAHGYKIVRDSDRPEMHAP